MVSKRDLFHVSGPVHLASVNWHCPHHRRMIAASLVQGAYVLERDRQQNRHGTEACASGWWEFFHFQLKEELFDDADLSIFGAIYEFNSPVSIRTTAAEHAPKVVIAFRGTIRKKKTLSRDLKLDLKFLYHGLHQSSRFELAMQAVRKAISFAGHTSVWLAGHSLGAAIATLVGKKMAWESVYLQNFLFNPPIFSPPIERIKDKKVKEGIRITRSFLTAGLAAAVRGERKKSEQLFTILAPWVPNLFLNPADGICSEYVGYFENRKKMEEIGAGAIGKLATQNSLGGLLLTMLGKESEPLHLLPSANLTVNSSPSPDFKSAHGIHQWCRTDLNLSYSEYRYE
ncbi:hypothetical protein HPP92_023794 [Vanilla planifolia]|uniref:Fungal lipase-type domain-containing protein n=1 Tax=Vanilla planifolia TaxID=51239 RepID=A0A835PL84_VANPL|nr:hypothetical protein HPP92_023794 [Vanilla planifolia]